MNTTFHHGCFHRGTALEHDIVERDYPCECCVPIYLAVATEGEEVAVGYLYVTMNGHEWEVPLLIIPDLGVWIVQPVFSSAAEALLAARAFCQILETALDSPGIPIHTALFPVEPGRVDLRGVDLKLFFDTSSFGNLREALAARLPCAPDVAEVSAVIDELMRAGSWFDLKEDPRFTDGAIPRWLHELLHSDQVAA